MKPVIVEKVLNGAVERMVNARDLHEALEISEDFSNWFKYQVESLQLVENVDYGFSPFVGKTLFN